MRAEEARCQEADGWLLGVVPWLFEVEVLGGYSLIV